MILTYKYRVKNLHGELNRQARAVNVVWNYCNDAQRHAVTWSNLWPSSFDLMYLTAGTSQELGLRATTIAVICKIFAQSRRTSGRRWLRYRGRKSLGWVPLRAENIRVMDVGFVVAGKTFKMFGIRALPEGTIKDGSSFSQDARGRWYLNICIEVADVAQSAPQSAVGIDLGLKELATLSTGETVANPRHIQSIAQRLAKAQRARKRRQAAKLHAKAGNARRDHLHKVSRQIVSQFDYIAVGNVNAAGLAKTRMAKSVLDAGWSSFRHMLQYKAIGRGAWFEEVNERNTTRVCSSCGSETGPKGVADLGIREWCCSACGAVHNRDQNAAINILLRSGHRALVEGAATERKCQLSQERKQ